MRRIDRALARENERLERLANGMPRTNRAQRRRLEKHLPAKQRPRVRAAERALRERRTK